MVSDEALVLLHMLSLNESQRARGELMTEIIVRPGVWGELARAGAIDEGGALTAVGREMLGEVQP